MTEKTFGQIAFEKWWSTSSRPRAWESLNYVQQEEWHEVGNAVAERCAAISQFIGVPEDDLDKFDWGQGYRAGSNAAALAIRNFIDLKDVLGATIETEHS